MEKTLYMLIGPKGSGKTYIGTLVENETDISFLRVENIWLKLSPEEDGWIKVEQAITMDLLYIPTSSGQSKASNRRVDSDRENDAIVSC